MRKFLRVVFVVLALSTFNFQLSTLTSCTKYSVECELVVQPRVMVSSGSDPRNPAYMSRVYAWYVDEKDAYDMNWYPASYADAEAGLVRHRVTGEVRSHGLMGVQKSDYQSVEESYVHLILTKSPVVLVAVDPINRIYAYRTFRFKIPLERIFVPVTFKTYQPGPYKENDWTIISEQSELPPGEEENPQQGE